MGGINGLLAELGVEPSNGLSIGGEMPESEDAPTVTVTTPTGKKGSAAFISSAEDKQRVYGPNTLPVRKSKSLLQFMWLALKDKVLVSFGHFGSSFRN